MELNDLQLEAVVAGMGKTGKKSPAASQDAPVSAGPTPVFAAAVPAAAPAVSGPKCAGGRCSIG